MDIRNAIEYFQRGELEHAETICKQIVQVQPDHAEAFHLLGLIYGQTKNFEAAVACITQSVSRKPDFAQAIYNLGLTYQSMGKDDDAVSSFLRVTELMPKFAPPFYHIGTILQKKGEMDEAFSYFQKAIELDPRIGPAYFFLGSLCQAKGLLSDALSYYQKAISLNAHAAEAYNNLGVILQGRGQLKDALTCFEQAIIINPDFEQASNNLGNIYKDLGMWDKAIESFKNAIRIKPDYHLAYFNLGNVFNYRGMDKDAISAYDSALSCRPDFFSARWAKCMAQLPIIYTDQENILICRSRYSEELLKLREAVNLENPAEVLAAAEAVGSHQPFLLACQGMIDKELQNIYGDLVCSIMTKWYPEYAQRPDVHLLESGEPIRIGIVSAYFHYHSIWKIPLRGWLENIDKNRFDLYGYHTGKIKDEMTDIAKKHCKRFVEDISSFEEICHIIREDRLHVLIYPEIGMDPTTLRLASLKLAPVQCTSLGHPDTSGLPTIDYYLSSDLMEPADADDHYTEKLIRLPNLGFFYEPLESPIVEGTRETFGLRQKSVLYLCSHALFTYLPQYDEVFPRIAQAVGDCQFLFIAHEEKESPLTKRFHARIRKTFAKFDINDDFHVTFLPGLSPGQYHAVNKLSDVFLDSIGWSSNNSTFEALSCGLPVVTLPGSLMRQRHCAGILTMMGLTETTASSVDEYVALAVKLAKEPEWRRYIANKISEQKHRIYRDMTCITALEDFLEKVIKEKL